jgi:hypothetical protein
MTEEIKEVQSINANLEKSKLDFKTKMIELRAGYAKAFNLFEQQVKAPSKNGHVDFKSKGGRTKYDYVTIDDLINSINHGIKGTGLSWQQEAKVDTQGQSSSISVRTIVRHENGYEYMSPWVTFVSSIAPQSIGSAITYAKRYSLSATFGINSETDDDAQQAQNSQPTSKATQTRSNSQTAMITSEQRDTAQRLIKAIAESEKKDLNEVRAMFLKMFGVSLYHDLTEAKAKSLLMILTKQLEKINARGDSNVK